MFALWMPRRGVLAKQDVLRLGRSDVLNLITHGDAVGYPVVAPSALGE